MAIQKQSIEQLTTPFTSVRERAVSQNVRVPIGLSQYAGAVGEVGKGLASTSDALEKIYSHFAEIRDKTNETKLQSTINDLYGKMIFELSNMDNPDPSAIESITSRFSEQANKLASGFTFSSGYAPRIDAMLAQYNDELKLSGMRVLRNRQVEVFINTQRNEIDKISSQLSAGEITPEVAMGVVDNLIKMSEATSNGFPILAQEDREKLKQYAFSNIETASKAFARGNIIKAKDKLGAAVYQTISERGLNFAVSLLMNEGAFSKFAKDVLGDDSTLTANDLQQIRSDVIAMLKQNIDVVNLYQQQAIKSAEKQIFDVMSDPTKTFDEKLTTLYAMRSELIRMFPQNEIAHLNASIEKFRDDEYYRELMPIITDVIGKAQQNNSFAADAMMFVKNNRQYLPDGQYQVLMSELYRILGQEKASLIDFGQKYLSVLYGGKDDDVISLMMSSIDNKGELDNLTVYPRALAAHRIDLQNNFTRWVEDYYNTNNRYPTKSEAEEFLSKKRNELAIQNTYEVSQYFGSKLAAEAVKGLGNIGIKEEQVNDMLIKGYPLEIHLLEGNLFDDFANVKKNQVNAVAERLNVMAVAMLSAKDDNNQPMIKNNFDRSILERARGNLGIISKKTELLYWRNAIKNVMLNVNDYKAFYDRLSGFEDKEGLRYFITYKLFLPVDEIGKPIDITKASGNVITR